jgi:hypothetical protein
LFTGAVDSEMLKLDCSIEEIITRRWRIEMGELTIHVNWLTVGISAILSFGLGAFWFSPMMLCHAVL